MSAQSIGIVGGGISGLALAHALTLRGHDCHLFEAQDQLGGFVRSPWVEGFRLEQGPSGFLDREPATRSLIEALGLSAQVVSANPSAQLRFVYSRGQLRALPHSPPAFLRSSLLSFPGRLRVLAELLTPRRRKQSDESLGDFGRRHFGKEATRVLVDALQTGIHAGDLERLSAASAFPLLKTLEREHRSLLLGMTRLKRAPRVGSGQLSTFKGGMQTLTDALGKTLGPKARTGATVENLRVLRSQGYALSVREKGQRAALHCHQVILATPAAVSAGLLHPLDPELSRLLWQIQSAPVSVVHLGFSEEELPTPQGFGFLLPAAEGKSLLGAIHVSTVFPSMAPRGTVLYKCMVGGARRPELAAASDPELVAMACAELRSVQRVRAVPRFARVTRWPSAIPQYTVGHAERLERIEERLERFPGLSLAGNAYRGVGVNDCIREASLLAARL